MKQLYSGEEAIAFFAKYGNTTPIKNIHCVKDDKYPLNPYKMRIVHDQIELTKTNEYFKISSSGIVQIFSSSNLSHNQDQTEKPSEFISLSDWMRENTEFNILSNFHFFRKFLFIRVLRKWRMNQRQSYFEKTR